MALFVAGFAAVAAMLPAGFAMERSLRSDTDAAICGRNALEVMKGKGMCTLVCEYLEHNPGGWAPNLYSVNAGPRLAVAPNPSVPQDVEVAADYYDPNHTAYYGGTADYMNGSSSGGYLKEFWNTNANAWIFGDIANYEGNGPIRIKGLNWAHNRDAGFGGRSVLADYGASVLPTNYPSNGPVPSQHTGDFTYWSMGRIHVYKNRSTGIYSLLDFSYPSSILDISARTQASTVMFCNAAAAGCSASNDLRFPDPGQNNWRLVAVTTTISAGADWPEQREGNPNHIKVDPTNANEGTTMAGDPGSFTMPGRWLMSGSFAYMRPKQLANCGDTGPNPRGNNFQKNWIYGRCDFRVMDGYQYNSDNGAYNPYTEQPNSFGLSGYIAATVQDAVDRKYKVPTLLTVKAIVYDKPNNLLLLRYPEVFAKPYGADPANPTNPTNPGNTQYCNGRVVDFQSRNNITPSSWTDRKLKVGDSFLTANFGYVLQVKDVLDPVAAGASAPNGAMSWSDGTYQLVRVTPSLASLPFTNNYEQGRSSTLSPGTTFNCLMGMDSTNREWAAPYLGSALVAPPPIAGGTSPWAATVLLNCGFNAPQPYANQNPFRPWANTAE